MKAENTQDQEECYKSLNMIISDIAKEMEITSQIIDEINEREKRKRYLSRLLQAKKTCLLHQNNLNEKISDVLKWAMEDESSFELKIYCIENNRDMFSNPKERYEWLIKDSLELSQSDVENDGGCGHHPCPNLGCQKVYK
ncbi:MAG: hypothetical protein RR854_00405 [Muribaculaceae bacterium]